MNDLEKYRKQIEEIDQLMANLFEQRMNIAGEIALYKIDNNLDITDSKREIDLINKNLSHIKNDDIKNLYQKFLINLISLSKEYQKNFFER